MEDYNYKKKYEDALSRAREMCAMPTDKATMEYVFPELKESEDERIRKDIKRAISVALDYSYFDKETVNDCLAYLEKLKDFDKQLDEAYQTANAVVYKKGYDDGYLEGIGNAKKELEKQGEQSKEVTYTHEVETGNGNIKALVMEKVQLPKFKVGDKVRMKEFESFPHICTVEDVDSDVYYCDFTNFDIDDQDGWELVKEPKFKVGDFIVNDYCMGRVVEITNDAYLLDTGQGIPFSCEHNAHLWSISDAKDGDVLYSPCCKLLWIYKDEKTCYVGSNLNYNSGSIVINKSVCIPTDVIPATKEQRELLFQKMKEAGYEWNPATKLGHKEVTKKSEQEPTNWTEEDEKMFTGYSNNVLDLWKKEYAEEFINWIKSLKQRLLS